MSQRFTRGEGKRAARRRSEGGRKARMQGADSSQARGFSIYFSPPHFICAPNENQEARPSQRCYFCDPGICFV